MLMNGVTFPIKEKRKRAKQTEKRKEKKGKRPGAPDEPWQRLHGPQYSCEVLEPERNTIEKHTDVQEKVLVQPRNAPTNAIIGYLMDACGMPLARLNFDYEEAVPE